MKLVKWIASLCSIVALTSNVSPAIAGKAPEVSALMTPDEHVRKEDQTFLTLPEWFLVHSPDEYAQHLKKESPSMFPFFGHIQQFWQTYRAVYRQTKDVYSFNYGYHVMVMTIGVSTTVEYALKGAYESVIGTLTEGKNLSERTDEDIYAAKVAQDYVDFIKVDPWYKFDFKKALKGLWDLPTSGKYPIRKWERRYFLTSEYLVKAGYGWLIGKATAAGYDAPMPVTAVVFETRNEAALKKVPGLSALKKIDKNTFIGTLPRYAAFTPSAVALAKAGAEFKEVAGNSRFILVSILPGISFESSSLYGNIVLTQPILTDPGSRRIVYKIPMNNLRAALDAFGSHGVKVEHIYDF
ncbi:hypothetical protein ACI2KR_08955 [Pseudomonas luteola]